METPQNKLPVDAIDVGEVKKSLEWTVYRCKTPQLPDVTFMAGLHISL